MLTLRQKFLVNTGTILNLIFILYFVLITAKVASDISNVLHIYMVQFLSNWTILIVMYCIIAFAVYGGTETVGSLNEIIFFPLIIIFFIPLIAIKNANILNIKPVLDSGMLNILKAVKETVFSYSQIEMILILYPFLQNNKKIKKMWINKYCFYNYSILPIYYYRYTLFRHRN